MHYILWIDEAWRGPWAGPIVAWWFLCPADFDFTVFSPILDDSKKLSENKREKVYHRIERVMERNICRYHFAYREAPIIDSLGIREANRQCMEEAIVWLLQFIKEDDTVSIYIDGCDNYEFDSLSEYEYVFAQKKRKETRWIKWKIKSMNMSMESVNKNWHTPLLPIPHPTKNIISYVINGDSLLPVISAASIVAKVTRDRMMCDFHEDFPLYGFPEHKGYGTKKHESAILHYGITPIHRKTYEPVKSLILQSSSI